MKTNLSEVGQELFNLLTTSTFYVVDCEYTATGDESRANSIISIAIVPVIQGRRVPASEEFYFEMNPGVPISAASTRVHGFTDASVKGKRGFAYYAPLIIAALDDPAAIFVTHTSADLHALRAELIRLDTRKANGETIKVGLEDLPDLPVIDTSTLARTLHYPGIGQSGVIGLARLCELTGVTNQKAHDARGDARAAADALLELLAHASQYDGKSDLNELLRQHRSATTHKPKTAITFREHQDFDPALPEEHIAKHRAPLDHVASKLEILEWIDLAGECASLRCQWLVDEATVAGDLNAPALLDLAAELLPTLTEPGQAATLLGAINELIKPIERAGGSGLTSTRAIRWWGKVRPLVSSSPQCGASDQLRCPACRQGDACLRDTLYQFVAQIAVLGKNELLTDQQVRDLFKPRGFVGLHVWNKKYPELAAFAAWYLIAMEQREVKSSLAASHLNAAIGMGLHLVEPRLTLLAAEMLTVSQQPQEAFKICNQMLKSRTSDSGYEDLEQWVLLTQNLINAKTTALDKSPSKHPRLARPSGRINPNPYVITEEVENLD